MNIEKTHFIISKKRKKYTLNNELNELLIDDKNVDQVGKNSQECKLTHRWHGMAIFSTLKVKLQEHWRRYLQSQIFFLGNHSLFLFLQKNMMQQVAKHGNQKCSVYLRWLVLNVEPWNSLVWLWIFFLNKIECMFSAHVRRIYFESYNYFLLM